MLSLADFRTPSFNLSVTRDGVGLEDEFELLMQLLVTYFNWLRWSLASVAGSRDIGSTACPTWIRKRGSQPKRIVLNVTCRIQNDAPGCHSKASLQVQSKWGRGRSFSPSHARAGRLPPVAGVGQ